MWSFESKKMILIYLSTNIIFICKKMFAAFYFSHYNQIMLAGRFAVSELVILVYFIVFNYVLIGVILMCICYIFFIMLQFSFDITFGHSWCSGLFPILPDTYMFYNTCNTSAAVVQVVIIFELGLRWYQRFQMYVWLTSFYSKRLFLLLIHSVMKNSCLQF